MLCSYYMPPLQPNFILEACQTHLTVALCVLQCAKLNLVLAGKPVIQFMTSCILFNVPVFLVVYEFLMLSKDPNYPRRSVLLHPTRIIHLLHMEVILQFSKGLIRYGNCLATITYIFAIYPT